MGHRKCVGCICLLVTLATFAKADRIAAQSSVLDMQSAANDVTYLWTRRANGNVVGSNWNIHFPDFQSAIGRYLSAPVDWSAYDVLSMRITNPSNHASRVNLIAQTSSNPTDYSGSLNVQMNIPANTSKLLVFPFKIYDPRLYGLRRLPPIFSEQFTTMPRSNSFAASHVWHWRLSYQETVPGDLTISDFNLLKYDDSVIGISDKYGQFTDREWSGKVHADADLIARRDAEDAELTANPGPGETFGSLHLPRQPQGSTWRIIRRGPTGRAYFVAPSGRLFWSVGINSITEFPATAVQGREQMFTDVPDQNGPFASLFEMMNSDQGQKLGYHIIRQNLTLKYGSNFLPSFTDFTKRRMKSWGFNTVGAWSATPLYDDSMPFVMISDTTTFPTRLPAPYVHQNDLPDPFDPTFPTYLRARFLNDIGNKVNKQNFMGMYVDNEMSWGWDTTNALRYNLALGAMNAPVNQPAKTELRRQMRLKYNTIEALNASWGTNYASWTAFANSSNFNPSSYSAGMIEDFQKYCRSYSAQYHGAVRNALRAVGFRGLYLGGRAYPYTTEMWQGALKYVDAFSINVYGRADQINWQLVDSLPKPVMLSEFSFGLQSDGTIGGPAEVYSTGERSLNLGDFMTMALHQRNCIGIHWFEYYDQPITGRITDGENYGVGLVDITDTPHPDTISMFRQISQNLYNIREGG